MNQAYIMYDTLSPGSSHGFAVPRHDMQSGNLQPRGLIPGSQDIVVSNVFLVGPDLSGWEQACMTIGTLDLTVCPIKSGTLGQLRFHPSVIAGIDSPAGSIPLEWNDDWHVAEQRFDDPIRIGALDTFLFKFVNSGKESVRVVLTCQVAS